MKPGSIGAVAPPHATPASKKQSSSKRDPRGSPIASSLRNTRDPWPRESASVTDAYRSLLSGRTNGWICGRFQQPRRLHLKLATTLTVDDRMPTVHLAPFAGYTVK
jgi:hypothetical protein